jgi:hypothetical protein
MSNTTVIFKRWNRGYGQASIILYYRGSSQKTEKPVRYAGCSGRNGLNFPAPTLALLR